jgi:hypothetical protein
MRTVMQIQLNRKLNHTNTQIRYKLYAHYNSHNIYFFPHKVLTRAICNYLMFPAKLRGYNDERKNLQEMTLANYGLILTAYKQ